MKIKGRQSAKSRRRNFAQLADPFEFLDSTEPANRADLHVGDILSGRTIQKLRQEWLAPGLEIQCDQRIAAIRSPGVVEGEGGEMRVERRESRVERREGRGQRTEDRGQVSTPLCSMFYALSSILCPLSSKHRRGMTLLEVLISIGVVAVGLLGRGLAHSHRHLRRKRNRQSRPLRRVGTRGYA